MSIHRSGEAITSADSSSVPSAGWRTFIIIWITQAISVFGSSVSFFTIVVWLTTVLYPSPDQKQQLAVSISAISLANALPAIVGAPIAGAWADRHDRRLTMMAMDFCSGLTSLVLAIFVAKSTLSVELLIVVIILYSIAGLFHSSAFDTAYAMIVPEGLLPRANGMMQTANALSGILAPGMAAVILSLPALARQGFIHGFVGEALRHMTSGMPIAIVLDAFSFFAASGALVFLAVPSPKRADLRSTTGKVKKSMWVDVKEGARFIWVRRPFLWLLGSVTIINFLTSPTDLFLPIITKLNVAADWTNRGFTFETAWGLVATVASIGGVVGGFAVSSWGGLKRRRIYGVLVPACFLGLVQAILGISRVFYLTLALTALFAALLPVLGAHSQTIWQIETPRELQGRVFSIRRLVGQGLRPLGMAMAGVLGAMFDPGLVLGVLGAILAVFCLLQFWNRELTQIEEMKTTRLKRLEEDVEL